ncbi:N-acetylglucosaminyl-phosphatidylinositol de-N-acetylase-like [Salvelinus namaycush]|uniref:N-acetylglucosaminyl-phosphatidylinositol de-N-acetylase-like n=1 Tax=Salvelinus namaycush TaxID=8040 RepID=A0A8U1C6I0_SALNM|nr:N-acetylglucosaminyl-phosphatidylinositol de-N-acetylase-like [Salvelinus namaycush]
MHVLCTNNFKTRGTKFLFICVSQGNYYNQGVQRREELLGSCAVLVIPASRVIMHDCKDEDMDVSRYSGRSPRRSQRRMEHLNGLLSNPEAHQSTLHQPGADLRWKRSGHSNHTAIYKSISYLTSTGKYQMA